MKLLRISLCSAAGNPVAIGARVSISSPGEPVKTAEIYAGSGYLSQSSSDLFFGIGDTKKPLIIQVNWPNGLVSTVSRGFGDGHLRLEQPNSM